MKKCVSVILVCSLFQKIFCGNICPCGQNQFANHPTGQVAVLARADTQRIKKITGSSSSKARTIKKKATVELKKSRRQKSREEIEKHDKMVMARALALQQRKRSSEESKDSKTRGRHHSRDESKDSQSLKVVEV